MLINRKDLISELKIIKSIPKVNLTGSLIFKDSVSLKQTSDDEGKALLSLTVTDLDIRSESCINLQDNTNHGTCFDNCIMDVSEFLEGLEFVESKDVQIYTDETNLILKGDEDIYTVKPKELSNVEGYPDEMEFEISESIIMNFQELIKGIRDTQYALSTDCTKPELNYLFFQTGFEEYIKLIATDGRRISTRDVPTEAEDGVKFRKPNMRAEDKNFVETIYLTPELINALLKLEKKYKGEEGEIIIAIDRNKIKFLFQDERTISMKCPDGIYPDFEGSINKFKPRLIFKYTFNFVELEKVVSKLKKVSKGHANTIGWTLLENNSEFLFNEDKKRKISSVVKHQYTDTNFEEFSLAINSSYLSNALDVFKRNKVKFVTISVSNNSKEMIGISSDEIKDNYFHGLMTVGGSYFKKNILKEKYRKLQEEENERIKNSLEETISNL